MPKVLPHHDFIDVLRILAAIAVVAIHASSIILTTHNQVSPTDWWLANIIDSASRWSVPVFLMISGAVILEPLKRESVKAFYLKRFSRIFWPLLFWIVVYAVANHFLRNDPLSLVFVLRRIIFDQPYEHLYFLFLLLELYVLAPFLRAILRKISSTEALFLVCLFFFIAFLWRELRIIFAFFIPYIGYFLAGQYFLHHNPIKKWSRWLLAAIFFLVIGVSLGNAYSSNPSFFYSFIKPPVALISISVFLFVKEQYQQFWPKFLSGRKLYILSSLTLGIYLIHPLIQEILLRLWTVFFPGTVIQVLLLIILNFAVSCGIVWCLQKIPVLKKVM